MTSQRTPAGADHSFASVNQMGDCIEPSSKAAATRARVSGEAGPKELIVGTTSSIVSPFSRSRRRLRLAASRHLSEQYSACDPAVRARQPGL